VNRSGRFASFKSKEKFNAGYHAFIRNSDGQFHAMSIIDVDPGNPVETPPGISRNLPAICLGERLL